MNSLPLERVEVKLPWTLPPLCDHWKVTGWLPLLTAHSIKRDSVPVLGRITLLLNAEEVRLVMVGISASIVKGMPYHIVVE